MKQIISVMLALFTSVLLPADDLQYVIKKGDTIFALALQHDITVQEILQANNIDNPSKIYIGQNIIIPTDSSKTHPKKHRITSGDTILGLAVQYNVSSSDILQLNKLNRNSILKLGQVLLIPTTTNTNTNTNTTNRATAKTTQLKTTQSRLATVKSLKKNTTVSLKTAPVSIDNNLSWPHSGNRNQRKGKFPGVVIDGQKNDNIVAVVNGRVMYAQRHTTIGNVVFVQDKSGIMYIYGGINKLEVKPGYEVKKGTVIGTTAIAPLSNKAEIYFSIWKDGKYLNPEKTPR